MNIYMKNIFAICGLLFLISCSEEWSCNIDGKTMYSVSASGSIGSAGKGCSCEQIRDFELRTFGEVDGDALKREFGCE